MRRVVCLAFAIVISTILLLVSCGQPGATTTTAPPPPTGTTAQPTTTTTVPTAPVVAKPKYGGILTVTNPTDPAAFDPKASNSLLAPTLNLTHDELLTGDWAKGPAGTGETDWLLGNLGRTDVLTGLLAESWEMPDGETIIFHLRQGVHWALDPNNEASRLVNGREFTAEDAAWNIKAEWAFKGSFLALTNPPSDYLVDARAVDKYTVELKVPAHVQGLHLALDGERLYMFPPEVTAKYGDQKNWKNNVTVGPFMLTDYVTGSTVTFKRNPNYYLTDPAGPGKGQQLPYVDGVKWLVIPDLSTRLAAFRTGKVDVMLSVVAEDAEQINKSNPKIEQKQTYGIVYLPAGREDKNLPFDDIRVRQALNLAVDQKAIVDGYYEGRAEIVGWPFYNTKDHEPFYTPLEQMPASVQELFTYNPEKAKQLLTEAGYPNGFKTNIVTGSAEGVDLLSIVREYLLKVGVDMEIKQLEGGVFTSVNRGRTHDEMLFKETKMFFAPWKMHEVRKESLDNLSFYENERTRAVYDVINANLGKNDPVWVKAVKDVTPFMLEQSPYIWMPAPYAFHMWQPWVKNFYGASDVGYFTPQRWTRYTWIDTELKKSMGF
ncbi:MAG: hypothetical protein A2147_06075 [Chloroflexi bacterium RBG_16_57_8]|nr:MAG: hypothetical protein A2147_06075 [Chloroflexi bacterium RBG_16_57_8]